MVFAPLGVLAVLVRKATMTMTNEHIKATLAYLEKNAPAGQCHDDEGDAAAAAAAADDDDDDNDDDNDNDNVDAVETFVSKCFVVK